MPDSDQQTDNRDVRPSRLTEARRVIEQYAAELREIIKKLGGKLH
ncbi:hypothetical protein [Bradyrhizobium sp. USDA 4486]